MKKIVFICSSMGGGGAEMVAVRLANEFSKREHSCYYYYWDDVKEHRFLIDKNVQIVRSKGRSFFSRISQLRRLILSEKIDSVISFTDIPNIISWIALIFIKRKPIFISTIHSNIKVRDKNVDINARFFLVRFLHKISCRGADQVVAVSNGSRRAILEYYSLPSSKVQRIYNPILNLVPKSIERTAIGETVKLIAIGRLTKAKNYSQMIYAIKKLQDSQINNFILDIYGEGELESEIKALIKELELDKIITLKGFHGNITHVLKSYDIFIMSSKWEGFGNVLVEALASGLRIVSTDYPSGAYEILNKGKYGKLVRVGDVQAFSDSIQDAVFDNIVDDTIYPYLEKFSIRQICSEYENILS